MGNPGIEVKVYLLKYDTIHYQSIHFWRSEPSFFLEILQNILTKHTKSFLYFNNIFSCINSLFEWCGVYAG